MWHVGRLVLVAAVLFLFGISLLAESQTPTAPSETSQRVVSVFSESVYNIIEKGRLWGQTAHAVNDLRAGSAFLVQPGKQKYLATAVHVVCGDPVPADGAILVQRDSEGKDIASYTVGGRIIVESVTLRVRVSNLSFSPRKIAIDRARDVALMTLDDDQWKTLNALAYEIKDVGPRVEQDLRVWGYVSKRTPQFEDAKVTARESGFFVLNRRLDAGFSGGPALDLSGNLLGLVVVSDEKQSRCVGGDVLLKVIENFDVCAKDYKDGMKAE